MSRLTASPFHKPSPFEFPRTLPVSPPETNSDSGGPLAMAQMHDTSVSVAGGLDGFQSSENDSQHFNHHSYGYDAVPSRLRRNPMPYHSSGIREAKERTVQRSSKSFVIVIPPSIVLQDHGQLGHTLSLGPPHRLAQGILMPLFPTLYGQLAAIAREFNFPSITGICLYFHFSDNGITSTPRISDDSWQMIWAPQEASPRSPICGKVEFDIDLRYARWYHAWVSSSQRDPVMDVPMSVAPSTVPSLAHFRNDSRHTDFTNLDDQVETTSIGPQSTARHVPKKLSLVDRLDTFSNRSFSRASSRDRNALSPPEQVAQNPALSPIFQEEEPQTAKLKLEKRVNNWRVSASLTATSLAIKQGQTSLEPANIPNDVSLDDVESSDGELNLEDFAWSVSSQGPPDYDDTLSILSWDRVPSVHLDRRNQGSVCMTPSTVTSFGPSDYTLPPLSPYSDRLLTPDLAHRWLEEVPLTPSTATSWGPPSEYPPSPFSFGRASSVDLAYRLELSRPPTPTTATSWGPGSWPPSPVESLSDRFSVHLAERGDFSRPVTPSTATSWGAPLSYPPSPATPFYVSTPDAGERAFDEGISRARLPWAHGWPYHAERHGDAVDNVEDRAAPWAHGWPYTAATTAIAGMETVQGVSQPWPHNWPYQSSQMLAEPWGHGWPYTRQEGSQREGTRELAGPAMNFASVGHVRALQVQSTSPTGPWEHGWPYTQLRTTGEEVHASKVYVGHSYPYFDLYPAVYPYNLDNIYHSVANKGNIVQFRYPHNLYHIYSQEAAPSPRTSPWGHGWPYTQLRTAGGKVHTSTVSVGHGYPYFDLYPAVYPHNLDTIYPSAVNGPPEQDHVQFGYPLNLYHIYPPVFTTEFNLDSVDTDLGYPFNLYRIYSTDSALSSERKSQSIPAIQVKLRASYPFFDLYPAGYPGNLETIYPPTTVPDHPVRSNVAYPVFDLYPAIEASSAPNERAAQVASKGTIQVKVAHSYPAFTIYSAVYPWNLDEIYPSIPIATGTTDNRHRYPFLSLYTPVYPSFDLYPSVAASGVAVNFQEEYPVPTSKAAKPRQDGYPFFNLYPPVAVVNERVISSTVVYPRFDLYPSTEKKSSISSGARESHANSWHSRSITLDVEVRYPVMVIYRPVYPFLTVYHPLPEDTTSRSPLNRGYPDFDIYPAMGVSLPQSKKAQIPATKEVQIPAVSSYHYPVIDLYPAVYPHLEIYPPVSGQLDHKYVVIDAVVDYPFFSLYPALYPHLDIYPSVSGLNVGRREVTLKIPAVYPAFDLYPAVYPFFSLWPIVHPFAPTSDVIEAPSPVQHSSKPPRRPKMTHAQLHHLVFPRGVRTRKSHAQLHYEVYGSTIVPPVFKLSKTHIQLHMEVFPPHTTVNTPSGTYERPSILPMLETVSRSPTSTANRSPISTASRSSISRVVPPKVDSLRKSPTQSRARSGSISARPMSIANASPPPTRGLPPRPDPYRSSMVVESRPRTSPPDPTPRLQSPSTQPLRRSASSITPSMRPVSSRVGALQTVDEKTTIVPLSRSSSLTDPKTRFLRSQAPPSTEGASAPAPAPVHRKRESLVLQRVRAINASNSPEEDMSSLMSKFPMPPLPPLPSRPS